MLQAFCSGRVFGDQTGNPPSSLLALHGWARDRHDFDGLFADLPEGMSGIAIDLPGFGSSPPPQEPCGSEEYAKAISGILDEMAPRPVILGHSFGGRVALHLAARYPDRVGALVLTGVPMLSTGRAARSPLQYRAIRALGRRGLISATRLESARHRFGSEDYRRASGVMRDVLVRLVNEHYEEVIGQVTAHVELVWGDGDTVVPPDVAVRADGLFCDSNLVVIPGVGHLLPVEAARVLADAIERCSG